jgi:hypothetical protein
LDSGDVVGNVMSKEHFLSDRSRYDEWLRSNRRVMIIRALTWKDPDKVAQSFAMFAAEFGFNPIKAKRDAAAIVAWAKEYKEANPGRTNKELLESLLI